MNLLIAQASRFIQNGIEITNMPVQSNGRDKRLKIAPVSVRIRPQVPTIMTTKNKIIKVWGATTSKNSFAAKEQKATAARQRMFGQKSRAQRSDAGKKRK